MSTVSLLARLKALFHKGRMENDLSEELRFHLHNEIEKNIAAGMTPEEARYTALRSFGGVDQVKEKCRDVRGIRLAEETWQDLRYSVRMLLKNPGFTAVVVLTLALGIGANTAIFSLMDAVMLKMLPVREPERLVLLANIDARESNESFTYPTYEKLRDRNDVFAGMFAFDRQARWSVSAREYAELAVGQLVSGSYHSVLGVNALAGRTLSAEDDRTPGAHPVAVISYGYWQRRFGLRPSIVGQRIRINGAPFTVVGVTPPEFFGVSVGSAPDITVPLAMEEAIHGGRSRLKETGFWWTQIMARLKPGVTEQQALAATSVVFRQILDEMAANISDQKKIRELGEKKIELRSGSKGIEILRRRFSKPLLVLTIMVGLVLLIACANIANLLLARAAARRREIAVRLALGAGRARLIRQLLTESLMLATVGGVLGVLFAQWGSKVLLRLASPGPDPIPIHLQPDLRILGFTAAVSLLTGILFGLAPAFRATRVNPNPSLAEGVVSGIRGARLSKSLVAAQVGLSMLLLVGAGLFVRTLQSLKSLDVGFDRYNLVVFSTNPVLVGYSRERAARLYRELLNRLETIPGVRSASLAVFGPLEAGGWNTRATVPGFVPHSDQDTEVEMNLVGPRFFETVGMPILAGRGFDTRDQQSPAKGVLINDVMARHYFGSENPVGRTITVNEVQNEVVGIVSDVKSRSVRDPLTRKAYVPFPTSGEFAGQISFAVRASGDVSSLIAHIRQEVRGLDPNVPLYNLKTMVEHIDQSLSQERLIATLASFFGLLGLLLVCVGLYGVMSYVVVRRTKEIGIRMALGARRARVVWMVFCESLILTLLGICCGLVTALASTRLLSSLLFGVTPTDALTIVTVIGLMVAVTALAGFLPAKRASKVDPIVALRYE